MKMKLVIGDWSKDGHSQSREVVYEVNKTVLEVQEAYKASCLLTTVRFDQSTPTGVKRDYQEQDKYQVAVEYEQTTLSKEAYDILKSYIPEIDNYVCDEFYFEDYEGLWWAFVKISLPDVTYSEEKSDIPNINGWWDDNLNESFGYGLFS